MVQSERKIASVFDKIHNLEQRCTVTEDEVNIFAKHSERAILELSHHKQKENRSRDKDASILVKKNRVNALKERLEALRRQKGELELQYQQSDRGNLRQQRSLEIELSINSSHIVSLEKRIQKCSALYSNFK